MLYLSFEFLQWSEEGRPDEKHDAHDVELGQTVTEKESICGKDFNDYEIYLNQAHTFNIGA